jgi:PAS domain S-box-containing protein
LLVEDHERWPDRSAHFPPATFHSIIGAPLKSGPEVIGIICLAHGRGDGRFTGEEVDLLGRFAELASVSLEIALDNARLYMAAQQELAERQRAEEALRRSEQRFRKIFEEGPLGMAIVSLDQRIADANPALSAMLGYSQAELRPWSLLDITHPDDKGRFDHLARQMAEGDIPFYKIQKRFIRKNGEVMWANQTRSLIRSAKGEPLYELAMVEDITDRKRAEEERDRFFTLSSDMLFIASLDGYFRQLNSAWESTLGFPREELMARPFVDLVELVDPEQRENARLEMRRLATTDKTLSFEVRLRRADGVYLWTSWKVTPYVEEGLLYGIGRDVTERKEAEEALRQARDELELRVKERTADLEAANEEIRSFAYVVSHDLRAPLINLKGFSSELERAVGMVTATLEPALARLAPAEREEVETALEEDIPEALDFIRSAVTRMDNLTNAILRLSRLGRRELNPTQVDTAGLVEEIVKSLAHQIEQAQASVTVGDLPPAFVDRTAMEQIMANLISNAILYLAPNRPGRVEIGGEQRDNETLFFVRDNGRGIGPQDLPKVFEPFRRFGKPVASGEGMGLAFVQTLVRRHGGRITCSSTLGEGTTFAFSLPNSEKEAADV